MKEKGQEVLYYQDLKSQEQRLIDIIRSIGYGDIVITIQKGIPASINEYKRSIKL